MSRLLYGLVDRGLADSLAKQKILYVDEFLRTHEKKIIAITKLHPKDILALKNDFTNRYLPPIVTGDVLYKAKLKSCGIIPTSIQGLDDILDGGLRMGTILEICGSSGSGKTQLCLNMAVNLAEKYKIHALYIDTKRDFVASHVASIICDLGYEANVDEILERMKVIRTNSMYALISTLHQLLDSHHALKEVKVVIVDSVASLYFPFIGIRNLDGNEGISLLNHLATLLKKLAVNHNVAVVISNLGTRWSQEEGFGTTSRAEQNKQGEKLKPSMGKYWAHVPNTRLIVTRDSRSSNVRSLTVHKSEYLGREKRTTFVINMVGGVR